MSGKGAAVELGDSYLVLHIVPCVLARRVTFLLERYD